MNTLTIVFKNRDDKSYSMKFPKMKDGITKDEAYELGNLIIEKNIFFDTQKELVSIERCETEVSSYL